MSRFTFELCAETVDACLAAEEGGAQRVELCSNLSVGGLTPSRGLILQSLERCSLPIHVLIRPRDGDFVYKHSEFDGMAREIRSAKAMGVAGVVFGVLRQDGTVDMEGVRTLMDLARPLEITFHRAFDATVSLPNALETIVSLGFDRILTSGGQRDVLTGSEQLASLIGQAGERIVIAIGGGLTLHNAAAVAKATGATHFHGSLRNPESGHRAARAGSREFYAVNAEEVRQMVEVLHNS